MIWAGAICLAGAVWFYWKLPEIRRVIRPIYRELGILPQSGRDRKRYDIANAAGETPRLNGKVRC